MRAQGIEKIDIFSTFLTMDILLDIQQKSSSLCLYVVHIHIERIVSRIVVLALSFSFMKSRKLSCKKIPKVTRF